MDLADLALNNKVLVAVVSAIGVIFGALLAGLANAYAANRKIREVELVYLQKLQGTYLENARAVASQCYIPLNIALTRLHSFYRRYKEWLPYDTEETAAFHTQFVDECLSFTQFVQSLLDRGADAYFTSELDERLSRFNAFVESSLDAKYVRRSVTFGAVFTPTVETVFDIIKELSAAVPFMGAVAASSGLFRFKETVVGAPLNSKDFTKVFETEIFAIKSLIKEVILGARKL